ncbi:response regulator transcription factor [Paenibacillus koleovorans]|uniref:response regulator transcription factor n=1 Tax=Paenibacillus koleovorans TaxID=121608 RepID=UPI000FDA7F92|nr:response regulator [Paenibacillus koleovorans]
MTMTYKVVLADDEHMIKRSLAKLIERSGLPYEVVGEAEDGREAFQLTEELAPDLIITDIRMPVMDGLELLEAVKAARKSAQLVILSGFDDFDYARKALQLGAFDYLLKPIKPAMFQEMLVRLTEKLQENEQETSKRSDWLAYTSGKLSPLAEQLWLLNAEEVLLLLESIHGDFISDAPSADALKARYADLLTLLNAELYSKHQESPGIAAIGEWQQGASAVGAAPGSDDAVAIYESVRRLLEGWMDELRASRRWGAHHHLSGAVEYMKANFADPELDLQRVADVAEMSASYFSRVFKQELGVSFVAYLTRLRLDQAKLLLEDGRHKTYEIALQVGYEDYPHFAKLFKKHAGVSPTEYRKRLGIK